MKNKYEEKKLPKWNQDQFDTFWNYTEIIIFCTVLRTRIMLQVDP